jgi:hypothetical protein
MAFPVQDRSHISWRLRTHRETHKLHNSWNCCTIDVGPFTTLLRKWELVMIHANGFWPKNWACNMSQFYNDNVPSHTSVLTQQFLAKYKMAVIHHPTYPLIWHPVTSSYFQKLNCNWKDAGLVPLSRSRSNRRECSTFWQKRTSRKRSKNGGDGGTSVYMRERITSRVMAADRSYGELYNIYSVSPEYFGYHHVCVRKQTSDCIEAV